MADPTWTPGPWELTDDGERIYAPDCGDAADLICEWPDAELSNAKWPANAHLIVAAPDLYAALEAAKAFIAKRHEQICDAVYRAEELKDATAFAEIDAYKYDGDGASMFDMIDAALAKAVPTNLGSEGVDRG